MLENGRNVLGEFHREDLLRRLANQVLRPEAAKSVHEMVLDGQVPASRVPETGPRSRQCSLLNPRAGGAIRNEVNEVNESVQNIVLLEMSIPILRDAIFYRVFNV